MELPNILRIDGFYTQKQYTKACNISVNTSRNRIKSRLVAVLNIDGEELIHGSSISLREQLNPHTQIKPTTPPLPAGIDKDNLVHVSSYSRRKGRAPDKIFQAILAGKIFGLIIAEEVFAYKQEIESL